VGRPVARDGARRRHYMMPATAADVVMAKQRYDVFLDARGLVCPMPLIKTRQALMVVGPGATVCVLATDPDSVADFTNFCDATGHKLLSSEQRDDLFVYVIEKA
jgi:tRNA 2-thiouridine synthesizing protein A